MRANEEEALRMKVLLMNFRVDKEQPLWMEVLLMNSWTYEVQPLWMEVPQVVAFSSIVVLVKAMSLTPHTCYELKSLDYGAITIEFVNCLPLNLMVTYYLNFLLSIHPLGQSRQLQGMDQKFDHHVWCKL
jgi:hypothetical protein